MTGFERAMLYDLLGGYVEDGRMAPDAANEVLSFFPIVEYAPSMEAGTHFITWNRHIWYEFEDFETALAFGHWLSATLKINPGVSLDKILSVGEQLSGMQEGYADFHLTADGCPIFDFSPALNAEYYADPISGGPPRIAGKSRELLSAMCLEDFDPDDWKEPEA